MNTHLLKESAAAYLKQQHVIFLMKRELEQAKIKLAADIKVEFFFSI
jgi:hypothetical protein